MGLAAILFRSLQLRCSLKLFKALINGARAGAAVKCLPVMCENTFRAFCAAARGAIHLRRVNIIADAVNHTVYILQLRMNVNVNANDSQLQAASLCCLVFLLEMDSGAV